VVLPPAGQVFKKNWTQTMYSSTHVQFKRYAKKRKEKKSTSSK